MKLTAYYGRLDAKTRACIATAYLETIRSLKQREHPSLSPDKFSETSLLICRRLVSWSALGVSDPRALKAIAIAGPECPYEPRRRRRVRSKHLKIARANFEARLRYCAQLKKRLIGRLDFQDALNQAFEDLSAARRAYVQLLSLWSEQT